SCGFSFPVVVESCARGRNELEVIVHESTPESRTIQRVMHIALMSITVHRLLPSSDRAFMKRTANGRPAVSARVNLTARESLNQRSFTTSCPVAHLHWAW